jgi:hypothetical protein
MNYLHNTPEIAFQIGDTLKYSFLRILAPENLEKTVTVQEIYHKDGVLFYKLGDGKNSEWFANAFVHNGYQKVG